MSNYYTENLSDFGIREIRILNETLSAWIENGLPDGFENSGVKPAMNTNSGYVFLVNDEYQVAMLNDNKLEIFHFLPYCGHEGFLADLIAENARDCLHSEDVKYILQAARLAHFKLSGVW